MHALVPCSLERWYHAYGFRARYNLSGSAAPPLDTADLLDLGGPAAREEYLALGLNYGPQQGGERLRTAIAARYRTLSPSSVQVTTGAAEALFLVLSALIAPGDSVVVQFPIYPSIYGLAESLGARVLRWPLGEDGAIDLDRLERLLAANVVRAVVLNHPHSPTGALVSPAALGHIAALAEQHGATLVVDEVYRGIQFAGAPTLAAADLAPGAVSIGDVAKPYGLGGLRVGWIASHDRDLLRRCAELRDYTTLCNSVPGEFLAALALEHHGAIIERHLTTARINRAMFGQAAADLPWLDGGLASGGFTVFPRIRAATSALAVCHELCERHDVLLLPGEVFSMPGRLRLGFGVDPADFAAGLERLVEFHVA